MKMNAGECKHQTNLSQPGTFQGHVFPGAAGLILGALLCLQVGVISRNAAQTTSTSTSTTTPVTLPVFSLGRRHYLCMPGGFDWGGQRNNLEDEQRRMFSPVRGQRHGSERLEIYRALCSVPIEWRNEKQQHATSSHVHDFHMPGSGQLGVPHGTVHVPDSASGIVDVGTVRVVV